MTDRSEIENAVVELAQSAYGDGSTVRIDRDARGGMIRVLGLDGEQLDGESWQESSPRCRTEDQAWFIVWDTVRRAAKQEAAR